MTPPRIELAFPHRWQTELLAARPLILPPRHFTYPGNVEEAERGALELLIQPEADAQPLLATCALGFRDASLPTGLWSTPNPQEICAVAGGYAYLIDTRAPERFTMLPFRPVFAVLPAVEQRLLLFASSRTVLAWGVSGLAWESPKLSDEGLTQLDLRGDALHGLGWNMQSDAETPFALDLASGQLR